ncbi:GNAT family N-acetyltransferase [Plantactinospora sp. KLBMP9567]|uniref:GNAT family N-acetyltransferase n=1 Tax=Plantactinospora sp. KLBMP9567 TaxID=3085900 RepID=UPI002981672B|nr:GNAT family N-acetyltransferase [Plantactinospora sp. KLBMP9567]MDW5325347.1 GNAT family N-acetyltransferase [Plantactinospora sp. KLBMP9567]
MNKLLRIGRATAVEIPDVSALIAAAIAPQPLGAWPVPDPGRRGPVLAAWARIWTEHAFLWGDIHLLDNRTAVAVWLPHDRETPGPVDYRRRLTAACGEYLHQFQHLDEQLANHHPTQAHTQLVFLATHPGHQRQGHADALLRYRSEHPRRLGEPTCGHVITTAGRRLLSAHGYVKREPITLPAEEGQIVPMWRDCQEPIRSNPQLPLPSEG